MALYFCIAYAARQHEAMCTAPLAAAHSSDETQVHGPLPLFSAVGHGAVGFHPAVLQVGCLQQTPAPCIGCVADIALG